MTGRMGFLAGGVSFMLAMLALARQAMAAPADYPAPEPFLLDGKYSAYQEVVYAYLKNNPNAPEAPRAALDLLVASTVLDDPATAMNMRKTLLLDYTSSTPTKYLMMQFRDGNEFTQLMYNFYMEAVEAPPAGFASKFDAAMRVGLQRFGGMNGPGDFVAFTAAMAHDVGDRELQGAAINVLKSAGDRGLGGLAMAAILTDDQTPLIDRMEKLHGLPERVPAIRFERLLISKMSDTEKQKPSVQRVVADDLLYQRRLAEALPLLEKLPGIEGDARLSFWRAASITASGDPIRGGRAFSDAAAKFPNDPWGKQAAEFAPVATNLDNAVTADVDALLSAITKFKHELSEVELNATYEREDHSVSDIYCGITGDRFELSASKDGAVRIGVRGTAASSDYFFNSDIPGVNTDRAIHSYSVPGVILGPTLQWDGEALAVGATPHWMRVPGDVTKALDEVMNISIFTSRDTLVDWVRHAVKFGRFPVLPSGTDVKHYAWLTPDPMEPNVSRLEYSIDEKNSTITLADGGFKINSMRFAPSTELFDLKTPAWPEVKVVKADKIDQAVAQAVAPAIESLLFGAKAPATQPTTQPATAPSAMPEDAVKK